MSAKISRSSSQVSCKLDHDTVVLQPKTGTYFKLNQVGTRIWELMEHPIAIRDIVSTLTNEFEVEQETCHQEVLEFLGSLSDKSLSMQR